MQSLLYANLSKAALSSQLSGGTFSPPKIVGGEDITLKLRFAQEQDGEPIIVRRTVSAIKASIGRQQYDPESGTFTLKATADAESAGVNTTAELAFDISAANLATALNALTAPALAGAQPFAVTLVDGSYRIVPDDGNAVDFSCVDNELWPASQVHIEERDYDEGVAYELRLIQAPVAQTTTFNGIVPAIPTMTQVRAGATNSGVLTTELQQLYVPPENPAGFSFCLTRGYRKTAPFVVGDDNSAKAIAAKLNVLANDTSSGFIDEGEEFRVYSADNGVVIEFAGDMAGINQDLLGIAIIAEAEADTTFTIETGTAAMATLLRKVSTTTKEIAAALHVQVWLEDEQDSNVDREFNFHIPITLVAPVSMESLIASAEINWATPLSRESYLQHSPTQVATGNRHYLISAFGNGSATEFTITHNLATRYLLVAVQQASATGQFLQHGTDYEIEIVSDNAIKLIFAVAPTASQYIGQITSAAHDANFEAHTHSIAEITGLEARLTAVEENVATLMESSTAQSLGSRDPSAGTTLLEIALPKFAEAYPMRTALSLEPVLADAKTTKTITDAGTTTTTTGTEEAKQIESIADIPVAALPKDGGLLPAIHDAASAALASPVPRASASNLGQVFQNRTLANVRLPGGGGRSGYDLKPGEFCGSDGRYLYPVIAYGVHNGAIEFTAATSDTITFRDPSITLANGTPVMCKSTTTLPAGLGSALTQLYVINSAAGSCKLSLTVGGAAVDVTDTGTGTHYLFATEGTVTSWYPRDFERELFVVAINSDAFLVKKTAEIKFGIELAILNAKTQSPRISDKITRAQWRLKIEHGAAVSEATPATTGRNIRKIVWNSTPILEKTIYITNDSPAVHTFGARIERTAAALEAASFTVKKSLYGYWYASASEVAVADFFIRATLSEFDVEDVSDARGFVAMIGLDKSVGGDKTNGKLTIK